MKNKLFRFWPLLLVLFMGCEDHDDYDVPSDLQVHDFIWKGLNLYYLWQPAVPDLADDRFESQAQLNDWLTSRHEPTEFFRSLLTAPQTDRFSMIFNDYTVLEGVLSGTTKNNGVDYGLRYKPGSTTEIFGWVRYILPGSDAAGKDIQRGDIFYAIEGEPLTLNNYRQLLAQDTYTLNLADFDNGNISPNGQSVTLTKSILAENPVYSTAIFEQGPNKVGYVMYNGFYPNFEPQLNQVFGQFKAAGITDLILDLRYNSGGSIATASRLASMVTGQFAGQVFAREQWNPKVMEHLASEGAGDLTNRFTETLSTGAGINHLNLSKVYILTSPSTASASELVINGLEPYIEVVQIGETTTGKNAGSITLYDSPNFRRDGRSDQQKYAMQPIVVKIVNRDGFGD